MDSLKKIASRFTKPELKITGDSIILPVINYDSRDQRASEWSQSHSTTQTREKNDASKKIGKIPVKMQDHDITNYSDLIQNAVNSILLLSEVRDSSKKRFNPIHVLDKVLDDYLNSAWKFPETQEWLNSSSCKHEKEIKKELIQVLKDLSNNYKPNLGSFESKHINGFGRLFETKLSKNILEHNNHENFVTCNLVKDLYRDDFWNKHIDKWHHEKPKEYPVGRLSRMKKEGTLRDSFKILNGEMIRNKFDTTHFMAFMRNISQYLERDVKRRQELTWDKIHDMKGNSPAQKTPKELENRHFVGITRRNVSMDSLPDLTASHTRPVDYKGPDFNQVGHHVAVRMGKPLGSGISGTTNIHTIGLLQAEKDAIAQDKPILNKKRMRHYFELLASTLCLDGGHSRYEVYKSINIIGNELSKFKDHQSKDLGLRLLEISNNSMVNKGGYKAHFDKLTADRLIPRKDILNAFTETAVQLRNGRRHVRKDTFKLKR